MPLITKLVVHEYKTVSATQNIPDSKRFFKVEWTVAREGLRFGLLIFSIRVSTGSDATQKARDHADDIAIRERVKIRKRATLEKEAAVYQKLGRNASRSGERLLDVGEKGNFEKFQQGDFTAGKFKKYLHGHFVAISCITIARKVLFVRCARGNLRGGGNGFGKNSVEHTTTMYQAAKPI